MGYKLFKTNVIDEYETLIVGSGAAGLNYALHLIMEGMNAREFAIITDNLGGGTSFDAGSDKQTYYKLSTIGDQLDSPYEMAKDLSSGGAMHGDIALVEATNSVREFFHLVQLGVNFPYDEFGGYVGYKTDNDPKQRATSVGPLTSRQMAECLLREVMDKRVPIFNYHQAIDLLTIEMDNVKRVVGIICLDQKALQMAAKCDLQNLHAFKIFKANSVILATGGPALLYQNTVYPRSQKSAFGLALKAGIKMQNITESQFGLASINFR
jgi:succinate dehydrogenase/fumarate reductase flavoprotein subunit